MVFVPTLDVDAQAGRVWAREPVLRVERWLRAGSALARSIAPAGV